MSSFDELTGLLSGVIKNKTPKDPSAYYPGTIPGQFGGRTGGAKWDNGLSASGNQLVLDHATLRQNARDAFHDSTQARAIINRMADTVAGTGIVLEPSPKVDILGITLEEGEAWGEDIANRYDSFCRSKLQHRSEQMNLYQATRFSEVCFHRDGETFVRLFYSSDRDLLSPLQFEFIDPSQIRSDAFTNTGGPWIQNDGITRDSRGREKSYKIWYKDDKKQQYKDVDIPVKGAKSKRLFMLHKFAPEYPGQGRGFSRLAHALQEFENITDFTTAQIKKAIMQSNIALFNKPSKDSPSSQPFQDMLRTSPAGPAASFGSIPNPCDDAEGVSGYNPAVNYCPLPEATIGTPGSVGVFNLEGGEELVPFANTAPSEGYDSFVNSFTSALAASFSMPVEVLLMKFNTNYSASRGALILFWMVAEIWRNEQEVDLLNPIYEMWLSEEIARGTISAPGWSNPVLKAAWLNCRWIGPSMPNIDPMKTYLADEGYMKLGATTQDRIAKDYNGSSGKANRAINARTYDETPIWPYDITTNTETTNDSTTKEDNKNG